MTDPFHSNLRDKGVGAKGWSNSWTEHEYLGVEEGKHIYAANLTANHRVFKDKTDGQWKKRKLTDNSPDYVIIQGSSCCVEVHPYYAKYFDLQHEEVLVEEERWVVQRLFKEPDTWRDVGAWNPVMAVEEYSEPAGEVLKVTITYETDYGPFVLEYVQMDGNALKHNITFTNISGGEETFRVVQRWTGIAGDQVDLHGKKQKITEKTILNGTKFIFGDDTSPFKICERPGELRKEGLKDALEMITGSREPFEDETILVDRDGLKLSVQGYTVRLVVDGIQEMIIDEYNVSIMVRAVEECPGEARVFTGGLGLGLFLLPLLYSHKATEIIICEIDRRVIDTVAPLVQEWVEERYPDFALSIIEGDVSEELSKHGKFDWMFIDTSNVDRDDLRSRAPLYLTDRGKYTHSQEEEIRREDRMLYFQPTEIDIHPKGLKADFIYGNWPLPTGKTLEVDPDTSSLIATDDGRIQVTNADAGDCATATNYGRTQTNHLTYGGDAAAAPTYLWLKCFFEWTITTLFGATLTANPVFKFDCERGGVTTDGEINPITDEQPSGATDANLWGYMSSGVAYVDPFAPVTGDNRSQDLGAAAKTDLQAAMDASQSWFAIGIVSDADKCTSLRDDAINSLVSALAVPKPTLFVTYDLPSGGDGAGAVVMGTDSLILDLLLEDVI